MTSLLILFSIIIFFFLRTFLFYIRIEGLKSYYDNKKKHKVKFNLLYGKNNWECIYNEPLIFNDNESINDKLSKIDNYKRYKKFIVIDPNQCPKLESIRRKFLIVMIENIMTPEDWKNLKFFNFNFYDQMINYQNFLNREQGVFRDTISLSNRKYLEYMKKKYINTKKN